VHLELYLNTVKQLNFIDLLQKNSTRPCNQGMWSLSYSLESGSTMWDAPLQTGSGKAAENYFHGLAQ